MKTERARVINNIMIGIKRILEKRTLLKIDISEFEWEVFLNNIYEYLEMNDLSSQYSGLLWSIVNESLSYRFYQFDVHYPLYLIKNNKIFKTGYRTNDSITINSLLEAFIRISKKYNIPKNDVEEVCIDIKENCSLGEVTIIKRFSKER